jgi:hypothetical protein
MFPIIIAAVLLVGCASFQTTPQQEQSAAAFRECKHVTGASSAELREIRADGALSDHAYGSHLQLMQQCLRERGFQ